MTRLARGASTLERAGSGRAGSPAPAAGRGGLRRRRTHARAHDPRPGPPRPPGDPGDVGKLTGTIAVAGSSTVFPISEAMAEEFKKAHPDVRVNVASTGTGSGFKALCAGETQVSDASRPVTQDELDTCAANGIELVEIPVAFDALSVVKNQGNDWASCLTVDDLATIFGPESQGHGDQLGPGEGGVPRQGAAALRPDPGLRDLRLLHRGRHGRVRGPPGRPGPVHRGGPP